jgi:hypothetical protein
MPSGKRVTSACVWVVIGEGREALHANFGYFSMISTELDTDFTGIAKHKTSLRDSRLLCAERC